MKRILLVGLVGVCLIGCQKTENETKELVSRSLKDPDSAKFQNIKGYCGEANAKNSYGGYTGFKRFYLSNGIPIFEDNDAEDPLSFERGWFAHCESDSKLRNTERTSCSSYSDFSSSVVVNKLAGGSPSVLIELIKNNEDADIYIKTINEVFKDKKINNEAKYAYQVLNNCLDGKMKVPF